LPSLTGFPARLTDISACNFGVALDACLAGLHRPPALLEDSNIYSSPALFFSNYLSLPVIIAGQECIVKYIFPLNYKRGIASLIATHILASSD
jgi:hypothetical protein